MKPSEGFVEANSTNLPKIDFFMVMEYMRTSDKYNAAEIRGAKAFLSTRADYVDTAVGYVEVKRTDNKCICNCRITPEHKVKGKLYKVTAEIDEEEEVIVDVQCQDCAAAEGGCKHALCFLAWLHKKYEEPSVTSVACYWSRPKLSEATANKKIVMAENLGKKRNPPTLSVPLPQDTFNLFITECKKRDSSYSLIENYNFKKPDLTDFSMFNLVLSFDTEKTNDDFDSFKQYTSNKITEEIVYEIQRETKDQADSKLWHYMRRSRITGSKIYEASRCTTEDGSLVEMILGGYKVPETIAIRRGKDLEKPVLQQLEKELQTKIENSGFILVSAIIGASPDGMTKDFIVEVKCPYSEKAMGTYVKNNHITKKFKAQVMLEMLAAKKKKAVFCLADPNFEKNKKIYKYWIDFDHEYTSKLIKNAEEFWKKYIFSKLLDSVRK